MADNRTREPHAHEARLNDMPNVPESHARHDPLDPVALAAGDLTGAERVRAIALIAACRECARLHDDVLAIARATAAIPAVARPREFTISPEQAARLRPAGWRRFVAAFASPQLAVTRQLGVAMTTLGLAGLLVSVLPSAQIGFRSAGGAPTAGSATQEETSRQSYAAAAAPSSAPALLSGEGGYTDTAGPAQASSAPVAAAGDGPTSVAGPIEATEKPAVAPPNKDTTGGGSAQTVRDVAVAPTVSLVVIGSSILLAAGILLLLARRLARKLTTG